MPHAAPLAAIRIIDDTRRLLRAPEVHFTAAEIGLDAFGYNIENRHLIAALHARAEQSEHLAHCRCGAGGRERCRRRHHQACRRHGARAACRRRRRAALALPRGGRHRHRPAHLSADRADAQSRARAAARRYVDGIPYRKRPVHARSPARPALEPRLRARRRARGGALRDDRRRAFRRDRAPRPFAARQHERRAGPRLLSARGRDRAFVRARAHCAGRRGRACGAADRRAGT